MLRGLVFMIMKKKILTWSVWLIILAAVGVFVWQRIQGNNAKNAPESYRVGRGTVVETVGESGVLQPVNHVNLSFEVPTVLEWVGVNVGDRVTKGQVMARVDRKQLAAQIAAARLDVAKAVEAEKLARRKWDTLKPEQRETTKHTTEQARATLAAVQAGWSKTQLVSPIDGIVTAQNARVGEVVTGTAMRVVNADAMQVEVLMSETDVPKLFVGQEATAVFDAFDDVAFGARITRIDPEATIVQDVTYYKTILTLADYDERMKPGMSVDVDVVISRQNDVLLVPLRFVRADDTGSYVSVRGEGKTYDKRYVELGAESDSGDVQIRSGLSEGDEIFAVYDKPAS